ncbi:MAG: blue light sensor protein, partial [Lysobacteraceae bacterium]
QPGRPLRGDGAVADDVARLIAPIADPTMHAYFAEFAKKHAA